MDLGSRVECEVTQVSMTLMVQQFGLIPVRTGCCRHGFRFAPGVCGYTSGNKLMVCRDRHRFVPGVRGGASGNELMEALTLSGWILFAPGVRGWPPGVPIRSADPKVYSCSEFPCGLTLKPSGRR